MKLRKRHIITVIVLWPLAWLYLRLRFNVHSSFFRSAKNLKPPYLIISNHNSDLDSFFISLCFHFPIFYVASDHIFRWGWISNLIRYLVSPIPKMKTTSDVHTIRDIISSLRSGASVGIFPEGNRSWNGETEEISSAIGNLVHHLSVPLLICRIQGGYLSAPRWGDKMRRGRIDCQVIRELSPQEIRSMTVAQLNNQIKKDLYINAAEEQNIRKVHFRGRNLAQSIETLLYICPQCGEYTSIHSSGNEASCSCGLHFSYDTLGILHGAPFTSVLQWDHWQTDTLRTRLIQQSDHQAPIFSDIGQQLYRFERAEKAQLILVGRLLMYHDRLFFQGNNEELNFPLKHIEHLDIRGRLVLQFSLSDGSHYEIQSPHPRSAYKYLQAFRLLKGQSD